MIHRLINIFKEVVTTTLGESNWGKIRRGVNFLLRKVVVPIFGWKMYHSIVFFFYHGYKLNLKYPSTFMEILQWQKYYGKIENYAPYVDKYEVRNYVIKNIGEKHLVDLLGVYSNPDLINYDDLPNEFVIKASHGSGWTIIVKDKKKIDRYKINKQLKKWLAKNYYDQAGEINYRDINNRLIIIEKYIKVKNDNLTDYKLWCFNGKFQFIGIHGDRNIEPKAIILDKNWRPLPIKYPEIKTWPNIPVKPNNFDQLIIIAEKLAKIFPFARVDLYSVEENVLFGELTITPGDGFNIVFPKDLDYKYGKLIPIENYPFIIN